MVAAKVDPQHHILLHNVERARRWFREGGPERGLPLDLSARHDFALFERNAQPTLPGPLPPISPSGPRRPRRSLARRPGVSRRRRVACR